LIIGVGRYGKSVLPALRLLRKLETTLVSLRITANSAQSLLLTESTYAPRALGVIITTKDEKWDGQLGRWLGHLFLSDFFH